MADELVCWRCGAALPELPVPLPRLAECEACGAQLHVCRMCRFHNPRLRIGCDESMAEEVRERERANFCDYFKPRAGAYAPRDRAGTRAARAQLDVLFGGSPAESASGGEDAPNGAAAARSKLDDLFGSGGEDGD